MEVLDISETCYEYLRYFFLLSTLNKTIYDHLVFFGDFDLLFLFLGKELLFNCLNPQIKAMIRMVAKMAI